VRDTVGEVIGFLRSQALSLETELLDTDDHTLIRGYRR
jgi:hypothetical protein